MIVIYKTTNTINNKVYIGIHKCEQLNDGYYGSGKLLKLAIKKYGKENFIIEYLHIYSNDEIEKASNKEKEYVHKEFTERDDNYNILVGGLSFLTEGENSPYYGRIHTLDTKVKISETLKLNWSKEEFKAKMVEIFNNRNNNTFQTDEFKTRISVIHKNKSLSEEHKQHLSDIRTGVSWGNHTEESKLKISEKQKGRKNPWNETTNKNPDKIRKTAETHRGMKRSDEAKENMRLAQQKRNEAGYEPSNKGKVWIHNPITTEKRYISKEEELPEGFIYGLGKRKL